MEGKDGLPWASYIEQTLFVIQGIYALRIRMLIKVILKVVAVDGAQCCPGVLGRPSHVQADNSRKPLS
jgi:hypothetical protein